MAGKQHASIDLSTQPLADEIIDTSLVAGQALAGLSARRRKSEPARPDVYVDQRSVHLTASFDTAILSLFAHGADPIVYSAKTPEAER